jgi:hypothetical protein
VTSYEHQLREVSRTLCELQDAYNEKVRKCQAWEKVRTAENISRFNANVFSLTVLGLQQRSQPNQRPLRNGSFICRGRFGVQCGATAAAAEHSHRDRDVQVHDGLDQVSTSSCVLILRRVLSQECNQSSHDPHHPQAASPIGKRTDRLATLQRFPTPAPPSCCTHGHAGGTAEARFPAESTAARALVRRNWARPLPSRTSLRQRRRLHRTPTQTLTRQQSPRSACPAHNHGSARQQAAVLRRDVRMRMHSSANVGIRWMCCLHTHA